MTPDEQDKLKIIHDDLNRVRKEVHQTRTQIEVMDERTKRIDAKTEKVDNRVFGPDGLESQVNDNSKKISRMHSLGTIFVGAVSTALAKFFNVFP